MASPDHTHEIDIELLPEILRDIVDLIGLAKTMLLVEQYGGVRLYVPKLAVGSEHDLPSLIGMDATRKLQAMYGGETHFDIPKAEAAMRAVRNKHIRRQRAGNRPTASLAREFGLTERQIRSICNSNGPLVDDRQAMLF